MQQKFAEEDGNSVEGKKNWFNKSNGNNDFICVLKNLMIVQKLSVYMRRTNMRLLSASFMQIRDYYAWKTNEPPEKKEMNFCAHLVCDFSYK